MTWTIIFESKQALPLRVSWKFSWLFSEIYFSFYNLLRICVFLALFSSETMLPCVLFIISLYYRCGTSPGVSSYVGGGGSARSSGTGAATAATSSGNSSRHCSPHHTAIKRSSLPASNGANSLSRTSDGGHRPTRLPVPRQLSADVATSPDNIDRPIQLQLLQDCQATKAMLLKLRTVLLNADAVPSLDKVNLMRFQVSSLYGREMRFCIVCIFLLYNWL